MSSTFTNLLYHVVFSTKYRRNLIKPALKDELSRYIGGIIRENHGAQLEIGGTSEHLHILARFNAATAVSDMLRLVKANSSKWANERSDTDGRFGWQTGYAAFSVSQSQVPIVRQYLRQQPEHHRKKPFREEFIELLKKHNVDFDPRYVFEEAHVQ